MKCGKLSKYQYTLVRNMRELLKIACPETQNRMVSSSKGVEVMICGLDHSGSQPFNYKCKNHEGTAR